MTPSANADVFRAVADATRRGLLDLLAHAPRSVNELAGPFDMSRPAVSQHLRVLLDAGLVRPRREGRRIMYEIDRAPLREVYRWAAKLLEDPQGHVWLVRQPTRRARN